MAVTAAADSLLIAIVDLKAMLSRSIASLERDDACARLPRAIRLGRLKRWRKSEILAWIEAGCPSRAEWEASQAGRKRTG